MKAIVRALQPVFLPEAGEEKKPGDIFVYERPDAIFTRMTDPERGILEIVPDELMPQPPTKKEK